jgi:hypothetical protein
MNAPQYYDGRIHTGAAQSRSLVVKALMEGSGMDKLLQESAKNKDVFASLQTKLADMYARLEGVAKSKDFRPSWWALLSRQHSIE